MEQSRLNILKAPQYKLKVDRRFPVAFNLELKKKTQLQAQFELIETRKEMDQEGNERYNYWLELKALDDIRENESSELKVDRSKGSAVNSIKSFIYVPESIALGLEDKKPGELIDVIINCALMEITRSFCALNVYHVYLLSSARI